MTDSKSPEIGQVFQLLNRWRHLPFYSLEPRASPFFALFLRDVLSTHFCTEMHEILIPEFPLRIGTLYTKDELKLRSGTGREPGTNQSYNVDYVALAKDNNTAYLVELKTDMGSKRVEQDEYLRKARDKEFGHLVKGVKQLAKASDMKQKYVHLLHLLSASELELVSIPEDARLYEKSFPRVVSGWTKEGIEKLEINKQTFPNTKVVFIQPAKDESDKCDFEYIHFKKVANIVQRHGDLGAIFANYLRQWTKEAGSPDPRDIAGS